MAPLMLFFEGRLNMIKRLFIITIAAFALLCSVHATLPATTRAHEVLVYSDDTTMHYLETETIRQAEGSYYAWVKIAIKNKTFENARYRFTPEADGTVTVSMWTVLPPAVEDVEDTAATTMPPKEKPTAKTPMPAYPEPLTMANVRPGDPQGWVEIGAAHYSKALENYWTSTQFYGNHPELAKPAATSITTTE